MKVISKSLLVVAAITWIIFAPSASSWSEPTSILIGLDADMSSGAAEGGEAIRRGAEVAIHEINEQGGILGRKLKLIVRDHRGNPARGRDNIQEFAKMKNLLAVLGGIHTPVALHELKDIHQNKLIYLGPWAAGTPIVRNGFKPNYVFRVSVRDAFAGGFLVSYAKKLEYKKLGLLFERTGWGRSNEKAVKQALTKQAMPAPELEWFNWGTTDLSGPIERLAQKGVEAILLVANPREGGLAIKSMSTRPELKRLPIISHWGITGGNFYADNRNYLSKVNLAFLQTFSFIDPPVPDRARAFFNVYRQIFPNIKKAEEILSPVGTAHAYDLIQLFAKAVSQAGSLERAKIRNSLENITYHAGLMKDYAPPFTADRHDALDARSFIMARFDRKGIIRPVSSK